MVGTSGMAAERVAELTPSASNFPSLTNGITTDTGDIVNCTRPVNVSVIASGMPLNGTWPTLIPLRLLNNSAAKCVLLPTPPDEYSSGFAFAIATRSLTDLTPSAELTTRTFGTRTVIVTPAK